MKKNAKNEKTDFTAREVAALIEDLRSQFRLFGDKLKMLETKIDGIATNQANTLVRATSLEMKVTSLEMKITSLEMKITSLEATAKNIQTDIAEIKTALKNHSERLSHLEAVK